MTFAADRRGRIPFAFIGALLLLSSSFYAVSVAPPAPTDPVADEVVTDTQVEARIAMDGAIRDASHTTAAAPVLEPSESGMGSVLSEETTFRDALELRVASGVRDALAAVAVRRDGLEATVSLPPIQDRDSARQALEDVSIREVADRRYRVRIENLHVTLTRHGQPVSVTRYNATLTMALPAIELHKRTSRYESRLTAGTTAAGFSRDLTARLFPIVWMRGYAQYGGAPIKNVLANRHVEVMANDALLAQQAAVFGIEDPTGRNATSRAAATVATRDAFLGAEETVKSQLGKPQGDQTGAGEPSSSPAVPIPGVVDTEQSVDPEHEANTAYLAFIEGRDGRSLDGIVDDIYQGDVRVTTSATRSETERESFGSRPANATRLFTETSTDQWHEDGEFRDGHGTTLRSYRARVIEERVRRTYWATNASIETTTSLKRTTYRVTLDIDARYRPPGIAPDRPIGTLPYGPTAEDRLREAATDRLLGGSQPKRRAVAAIDGGGSTGWQTLDIDPPAHVTTQAQRQTADLRRAIQDVSVTLETRSVASSTNPAAELRGRLTDERPQLLDIPYRYDSLADRAVAAARLSYYERVTAELGAETPKIQQAQNAFADMLGSRMIPSGRPERSKPSTDSYVTSVDGGPAYLSADPPDGSDPPLAARNVNLFTVPYGDTADAIVEGIGRKDRQVSIRTAAQTLAVLERTDRGAAHDRRELRRSLADSVEAIMDRYHAVVARDVGYREADRAIRSARHEWTTVHGEALAIADGRMAEAIEAELPHGLAATDQDRLRVALRVAGTEARSEGQVHVPESLVEQARQDGTTPGSPMVEESIKSGATEATTHVWERQTGTKVGSLPAGLPLLPTPGSWYATVNAWTVEVTGQYDHFTVATRRAAPGRHTNGTVEYVRENRTITADIDNDGQPERLGRNRPISFDAQTGVIIVVPPGKTGVGDVDGQAIETSSGW